MNPLDPVCVGLVAVIAALYSSVGHGGASGYLALLAFSTMATKETSVLALVMNCFVATVSFLAFQRAKHFTWTLAWPFLLGSIPFAFIGGSLRLSEKAFSVILAVALGLAALRLLWQIKADADIETKEVPVPLGAGVGAGIGLLSGMVGVGGGIFLSPVIILAKWADAKQTSSVAALFIILNSIAGLAARPWPAVVKTFDYWPLMVAGVCGAVGGSMLGANIVPNIWLRRCLGGVLVIAVVKLILKH